ncbi:17.0 kDa class II heat shock protein [Dendrobium catenatum]|uniref:17.9 kDa class II heat shock protein n=1 Tax=Dendrobium catenatum TaxID=906689 RepID=A0A2I0VE26_9ASPA|nr:17.0 kDa class II heat shock protein [Dendrobium catenatum]PKU61668.1 17.9 kDa class II heat shock protein [Dendrobium catenatum]
MDFRSLSLENPLISTLHYLVDLPEEWENSVNSPMKSFVRDTRAMASTPADVKELPSAYEFVLDVPGLKYSDINVEIKDENLLVITGERLRNDEKDEEEGKYLRIERRMGKFMRKFTLPDNVNVEVISAVCREGVLTVTVEKLPPPEQNKTKKIEVKIA